MFSLKFYPGGNRGPSGADRSDALFVYLIDIWAGILKSRFADNTKFSLAEKIQTDGNHCRESMLLLVFLLLLGLPLLTLLYKFFSSTC